MAEIERGTKNLLLLQEKKYVLIEMSALKHNIRKIENELFF